MRYLRGSEHQVGVDEIRPCAFIPGQRIVCNWPWWGPYTGTLVSYDAGKQRVKLSDGWGTKTFPIAEVWLAPDKVAFASRKTRLYLTLGGAGVAVGAAIGSLITALVMR